MSVIIAWILGGFIGGIFAGLVFGPSMLLVSITSILGGTAASHFTVFKGTKDASDPLAVFFSLMWTLIGSGFLSLASGWVGSSFVVSWH